MANDHLPRRARACALAAALTLTALCAACGGGGGSSPADAAAAVDAPASADACAGASALFLQPAVASLLPRRATAETDREAWVDRAHQFVDDVPKALKDQAKRVRDLGEQAADRETAGDEELAAATRAVDQLTVWAATQCDLPDPVWGCLTHHAFRPVGEAIGGEADGAAATTPEAAAAVGTHEGLTRAELGRKDGEVLFGWVDSDGLVRSTTQVVQHDGRTWSVGETASCNDS